MLNRLLPPKLWIKMTVTNILLLVVIVLVTGFTLYQTACFLAADITGVEREAQMSFNSSLLTYAWIIGAAVIVMGAVLYSTVTKKVLVPIKELTSALETMKSGKYPDRLESTSDDEISELVEHFNHFSELLQHEEASRNQMLRDLSHELRTPLSNLQGYLEALEKGVLDGDQRIYRSLAEETERVTRLVHQLDEVETWKSVERHGPLQVKEEDIRDVITKGISLFAVEFERAGIPLEVDLASVPVSMNREGIQQVCTNLLNNALEYHVGEAAVEVSGRQDDKWYELAVAGEGEQIPVDANGLVFDRFYRVDTSRSGGGSGLGLAISKEIIQRHGGEIGLDSYGNWHRFYVRLPLEG